MKKKIKDHFQKVDPILFDVIQNQKSFEVIKEIPSKDYFGVLCSAVVGQQLAGKAARAIHSRFVELFSQKRVTSKKVLGITDKDIRDAGLSWGKVRCIKDFAEKVERKEVNLRTLFSLSDEEVIVELTKVKGMGPWTAEMFLMFSLGRDDVFSHGDLGLRRAIEDLYKIKDPSREKVDSITKPWSPYRSWGSRVLWQYLDGK